LKNFVVVWEMLHDSVWSMAMAVLNEEIAAYDAMRKELEADHMGKWVLLHGQKLISVFNTFESAAEEAVRQFGRGPYLIRQIGAPPLTLPASVMYRPEYGAR
jgi:uncharacterized protein with PIN domain